MCLFKKVFFYFFAFGATRCDAQGYTWLCASEIAPGLGYNMGSQRIEPRSFLVRLHAKQSLKPCVITAVLKIHLLNLHQTWGTRY